MRTASASSANGISAATEPKTSSRAIGSAGRRLDERRRIPEAPFRTGASPRKSGTLSTSYATVSRWEGRSSGPISVVSSAGSPTFDARRFDQQLGEAVVHARWTRIARTSAAVLAGVVEDGVRRGRGCPLEIRVGETTFADLPPSSSVTRLIVPAAPRITCAHLGRAGEADLRHVRMLDEPLPTTEPLPATTLRPLGMPASSASSASRSAESGVSSAGFSTTVLPHASAGPSFQLAMLSGKFQGTISRRPRAARGT